MGPLSALCVALALLGALKGHSWWLPRVGAQILKSFQKDQFQGTWFVLGLAGSTHSKADRSLLSPFTATFEQSGKHHLEVSFAMNRGPRCLTWSYLLTPTAQPGQFSVDSSREPGAKAEVLQVHDTDYTTFALMVSRRQSGSQSVLRVYLLCEPRLRLPATPLGRLGLEGGGRLRASGPRSHRMGVPATQRPCRRHKGPRPVLGLQAECGRSRSRRWTGSSACSEPRASRRRTSFFQTWQTGQPIRERAEGWSGPGQALPLPSTCPQRGSQSPPHRDLSGCGSSSPGVAWAPRAAEDRALR